LKNARVFASGGEGINILTARRKKAAGYGKGIRIRIDETGTEPISTHEKDHPRKIMGKTELKEAVSYKLTGLCSAKEKTYSEKEEKALETAIGCQARALTQSTLERQQCRNMRRQSIRLWFHRETCGEPETPPLRRAAGHERETITQQQQVFKR